jgi:hypothetical protein
MSVLFRFYGWYLHTLATARQRAARSRAITALERGEIDA